LYNKLNI